MLVAAEAPITGKVVMGSATCLHIDAELTRLRAEVEALRGALHKIHKIRNDIIKRQKLGWSAHVYPLVAVLSEVRLEYEDAAIDAAKGGGNG